MLKEGHSTHHPACTAPLSGVGRKGGGALYHYLRSRQEGRRLETCNVTLRCIQRHVKLHSLSSSPVCGCEGQSFEGSITMTDWQWFMDLSVDLYTETSLVTSMPLSKNVMTMIMMMAKPNIFAALHRSN